MHEIITSNYFNFSNEIFEEYNLILYSTLDFYEYKIISRDIEIKNLKEKIEFLEYTNYNLEIKLQNYAENRAFSFYFKMCIKRLIKKIIPKYILNKIKFLIRG